MTSLSSTSSSSMPIVAAYSSRAASLSSSKRYWALSRMNSPSGSSVSQSPICMFKSSAAPWRTTGLITTALFRRYSTTSSRERLFEKSTTTRRPPSGGRASLLELSPTRAPSASYSLAWGLFFFTSSSQSSTPVYSTSSGLTRPFLAITPITSAHCCGLPFFCGCFSTCCVRTL